MSSSDRNQVNTINLMAKYSYPPSVGLVSLMGGKWTTYRLMAEETVDEILKMMTGLHNKLFITLNN